MAVDGIQQMDTVAESERNKPASEHQNHWRGMSRLARILRRERAQGNNIFPVQLTMSRIGSHSLLHLSIEGLGAF